MTSIGVVAASAGGVETLRVGLVQPLLDDGHQVAITLTPTAAAWLDHLGERQRLEDSPAFPSGRPHRYLRSRSLIPRATFSSARH
jgi:hypothetical protein